MKLISTFACLFSMPAFAAAPNLADLAAGVKADKKPYFAELARETAGEKRFQKSLRTALARLVICRIDSPFAGDACEKLTAVTVRKLNDFEASPENGRILLGAVAAALAGARATLSPAASAEAAELLPAMAALVANGTYTEEERARFASLLAAKATLRTELGSGSLSAFAELWAQLADWLASPALPYAGPRFAAQSHVVCAIVHDELQCDGSDRFGALNPPPLHHPRAVGVARDAVCALDADGVKCWGAPGSPLLAVPSDLQHPYQLVVGTQRAYALDDNGLHAWPAIPGSDFTSLPDPTDIDFDPQYETFCLRYGGREKCTFPKGEWFTPFTRQSPTEVPFKGGPCRFDGERVTCPALLGVGARALAPESLGGFTALFEEHNDGPYSGDSGAWACATPNARLRCGQISPSDNAFDGAASITKAWGTAPVDRFSLSARFSAPGMPSSHVFCGQAGDSLRCVPVFASTPAGLGVFEAKLPADATLLPGEPCVADAEGILCLDWEITKPLQQATLRRVVAAHDSIAISVPSYGPAPVGGLATCWAVGDAFHCGVLAGTGMTPAPSSEPPPGIALHAPLLSAAMAGTACALDLNGIQCWRTFAPVNDYRDWPATISHQFRSPRQLVMVGYEEISTFQVCALDDDGVQCFGSAWNDRTLHPVPTPAVPGARSLVSEGGDVCAAGAAGLRCWNYWW